MADAPPLDEAPERMSFVDVGFSTITRRLQELSGREVSSTDEEPSGQPYAFVFVARSGQSAAFNGHFPQMVAFASKASPGASPIRLVGYSKACGERLSSSIGLPRVSSIGIRQDAPGAEALIKFVRERVSPIPVAWMEEAVAADFRPCKVLAEEKMVPVAAKTLPSR
jgi:ribonuclease P/MRP protein subunit POP3